MSDADDRALDALLRRVPPADHVDDGLLGAYRSGALTSAAAAEVEAHLGRCDACRALLAVYDEPPSAALLARAEEAAAVVRPRWGGARTAAWVGGLVAAAAAALLVLALPRDGGTPLPDYEAGPIAGGVKFERGAEETASGLFLPESRLRLDVRPVTERDGEREGAPPAVAVFVSRPGGPLRRATAGRITPGAGGMVRFEADAGALFGAEPGAWTVHLILARDAAALDDLEGQPAEAIPADANLRRIARQIEYRMALD